MALQLSLRRGVSTLHPPNAAFGNALNTALGRRYKSSDVGDVIGIDLGTTNSCVAIMVSSINVSAVVSILDGAFLKRPYS
jgi:hypothetical protein